MQIQEIVALIDKLDAKLAVLLCHHNADPDAIGSAFAFKGLLSSLKPNLETEIAAASGPSRISKVMMDYLHITLADTFRVSIETNARTPQRMPMPTTTLTNKSVNHTVKSNAFKTRRKLSERNSAC